MLGYQRERSHRADSVTAAAEYMDISQSAISYAISKLEKRHQVRVWRKTGRSLQLTQAGQYLWSWRTALFQNSITLKESFG
jgi:DNA-binding transcriptional LysR family regulator